MQQHIIKKQTIDLSVDKKLDPFHIQQQMSELYMKEILPVLEKLFNETSNEEETHFIDSLEIDLGIISENELYRQHWREVLLVKIADKCEEKLATVLRGQANSTQIQQKAVSICQQWIFYMKKGYLPWNAMDITEEWKQKVIEALAVDFSSMEALRNLIKSNPKSLTRIVEQHTEAFLVQLLEILTAGDQKKVPVLLSELETMLLILPQAKLKTGSSSKASLHNQLWCHILAVAAEEKEKANIPFIGQYILRHYIDEPAGVQEYMPELKDLPVLFSILKLWERQPKDYQAKQKNESSTEPPKGLKDSKNKGAVDLPRQEKGGDLSGDKKASKAQEKDLAARRDEQQKEAKGISSSEHQELSNSIQNSFVKTEGLNSGKESEPVDIEGDGIFVTNAGIVLLHPFLGMFFNLLELVEEGKFKNDVAHQKALYLLHYLATGETIAEECDLVIPKVLTAYPLAEPVDKDIPLREEETEEADHLLKEVIRQWEKLKNSSPDELRRGFLQRKAKFFTKNDQRYLQFETDSIDILLDYLPWNLNIIKLPWMRNFLRVEWR